MSGTNNIESKTPVSYLSGISAINPWGSRSSTPKPGSVPSKDKDEKDEKDASSNSSGALAQQGGDHSISHGHRLRIKNYPLDCPKLDVQWFHAVDSAIRKPHYGAATLKDPKPIPPPKKWMSFSANDSHSIEMAYHKLADKEDEAEGKASRVDESSDLGSKDAAHGRTEHQPKEKSQYRPSRSLAHFNDGEVPSPRVAVNEDYLFDVDVKARELGPAYWMGPIYGVRRGTWFYVEGSTMKPCDENLAFQLEEGFVKTKPWRNASMQRSASQHSRARSSADALGQLESASERPRAGSESTSATPADFKDASQPGTAFLTYRLFGSHMNFVVTYEDETTAWLLSDDFLSRMSSTVYQRFAGGAHRSGTKVVRGFQDLTKKKTNKDGKRTESPARGTGTTRSASADSGKVSTPQIDQVEKQPQVLSTSNEEGTGKSDEEDSKTPSNEPDTHMNFLHRQMSNLVTSSFQEDSKQQEEERRMREEKEIREDYKDVPGDSQDREIEHLVLVTHGIGQRLGARFETFNFIHDVNELRKTLKAVYSSSEDLQALNGEVDKPDKNCRIQVLPICWRHKLDFPRQSLRHNRKEYDLADVGVEEDDSYPSLDDITIEGVPALRNIVADLALDVLLYQTPAYKVHISEIVAKECNRIAKLFKQRNPQFHGKVTLIGHSLGSAVFFDLLSDQVKEPTIIPHHHNQQQSHHRQRHHEAKEIRLDFDVENLVCFGSPIGLFQMLNGKTIGGRRNPNQVTLDGLQEGIEDPFAETACVAGSQTQQDLDGNNDAIVSSPKCRQLYNIFHPSDPIAYRIEPLISPSMSLLKPQALPYTKRSFLGAPSGHGITGIPALVGQSFSGFFSSLGSGIANNFINRSLGISAEDAVKLGAPAPVPHNRLTAEYEESMSVGGGTNITSGGVVSPIPLSREAIAMAAAEDAKKRKLVADTEEAELSGRHPPTLIDNEIETLYSGFQKRRKSRQDKEQTTTGDLMNDPAWREAEERGRKLKREEAKVRALNTNGRVDYSIQEGAFDISFLSALSTHLSYWSDLDVCHFLQSQLLSKQRTFPRS